MRAFVAVVEANGFSSAARHSTKSKALLSKYIAQLEDDLDTRLLQRTTRQISTTEVGRAYYERCLSILDEVDELELSVKDIHASPSGELRITAPTSFAEIHLMKVVSEFSKRYPDITINMMLTDRTVDIVGDGIDLALRIGNLSDSNLIARRLGEIKTVACASPKYLTKNGTPKKPDELINHQCIIDTNFSENTNWSFSKNGIKSSVAVKSNLYVNSPVAVKELAINHNGIAICPDFVLQDDIKSNRLNVILEDYEITTFGLYAVYSHRRHLSTKVRLFIDLMLENFSP